MTPEELLDTVRRLDDEDLSAVVEFIRALDEARVVVNVGGNAAETAARNPQPEKR